MPILEGSLPVRTAQTSCAKRRLRIPSLRIHISVANTVKKPTAVMIAAGHPNPTPAAKPTAPEAVLAIAARMWRLNLVRGGR
ncbi:hypothetical protein [Catenulispora subtropica]|uniref:Uncharacterized protein n=1 Tax=Catenulispora subtropica TaxID=450798 RepID=A0ABP5ED42_9ACTN